MAAITNMQIGKQGLTSNFIESLKNHFKNHQNVKISVLRNAVPDNSSKKEKVKEYSEKILLELGNKYTSRVIVFTINLKKWRKEVR